MRGESLAREDVIQSKGLEVRNEMKAAIKQKLESSLPGKIKVTLEEKLHSLSKFAASRGWAEKFMRCNRLASRKRSGTAGYFPADNAEDARKQLRKELATV